MMMPPPPEQPKEKPPYEDTECQWCKAKKVALKEITTKQNLVILVCPKCDGLQEGEHVKERVS